LAKTVEARQVDTTVFAIAGDASNAATPAADRITFRLVVMVNPCVPGSHPASVSYATFRIAQETIRHRAITKAGKYRTT
jgi:hypothetical protein